MKRFLNWCMHLNKSGVLNYFFHYISPITKSDRLYISEAKITIADFAVSGISGVGIGATDILNSRLNSGITKFSRSMTSEEDTATITFPSLNITDADNDVIMLTLLCQGILQDFMGM